MAAPPCTAVTVAATILGTNGSTGIDLCRPPCVGQARPGRAVQARSVSSSCARSADAIIFSSRSQSTRHRSSWALFIATGTDPDSSFCALHGRRPGSGSEIGTPVTAGPGVLSGAQARPWGLGGVKRAARSLATARSGQKWSIANAPLRSTCGDGGEDQGLTAAPPGEGRELWQPGATSW